MRFKGLRVSRGVAPSAPARQPVSPAQHQQLALRTVHQVRFAPPLLFALSTDTDRAPVGLKAIEEDP